MQSRTPLIYRSETLEGMLASVGGSVITVTGPATEDHTVPAEVLVSVITGVQRSVWLIAAAATSRTLHKRFTPDQAFRQKFTLRLSAPTSGSFEVPLSLVDERKQRAIPQANISNPLGTYGELWSALAADDLNTVFSLVADESYRARILNEFLRFLPRRGDQWAVGYRSNGHPPVELTPRHRTTIDRLLKAPPQHQEMSVIGELRTIHIATRQVVILYPPTHKEILCSYREEIEDTIVDRRHELFQITGRFALDGDGNPKELTDVRSIEPVDLSAVVLEEIDIDGATFIADPPLAVDVRLDADSQQFFEADVEDLCFFLSGQTREDLIDDLSNHIEFVWQEYAMADDAELSEDGRRLKAAVLTRFRRKS